jgi:hypothetical protein
LALGMDESGVRKWVARGRLHRFQYGAYSVGHRPPTREARFMAAVLACGPGAVLSHRSAAVLLLLRTPRREEAIHVTAPNRRGRSPAGILAHRDGSLAAGDRRPKRGIPCTTVERTLLDLAAIAPIEELREAVGAAEGMRKLDRQRVRALIRRHRGRRGVARLRLVLDEVHPESERTRSELERMFLRLCTRALLEADFLWASVATAAATRSGSSPAGTSPAAPGRKSKTNPAP